MALKVRFFTILVSLLIFIGVFCLVRKRKLSEEFSWLWMLISTIMMSFALWPAIASFISRILGIISVQSMLFFFGLIFLTVLNLFISIKLSNFKNQIKTIAQKQALLEHELKATFNKDAQSSSKK
jgi:hypothetical protein